MNSAAKGDVLIEVKELRVTFPAKKLRGGVIRAVDGVSLSIERGEVLSVVGESGCGKTTLGKAVLGIVKGAGSVIYDGIDLAAMDGKTLRAMRKNFQMIYQDPYESLDPRQSVGSALMEPLLIHRPDMAEFEKRDLVLRQLEAVGLFPPDAIASRYPHHLSGGERQRVAIASAIILEPDFVVADEPVSMLDVSVRSGILRLMLDLQGTRNLTYVFITHDLSLAWMISQRIAVFYLGRMVEIGRADDVVHNSAHPYTNALVSVIPRVDRGHTKRRVLSGETPSAAEIPSGCGFHTRCWLYADKGKPCICRELEPELRELSEGHAASCHFGL
ncbi:MAG: ABC transporter ATP-binding protein [Synergistaceae bacterium]|jgi:oligopeptide/dipeptide ABC transporter ATP-binding protein|nr:ABC transporter ATP-binding protein [Synergistaceae bacterium]